MAEHSKFAGALARLKQPVESSAAPLPGAVEIPIPPKGRGRPSGKRSDPAWKAYTILLRKETHKGASRRLHDDETGQDLSELVDELLTDWLRR